MPLTDRNREPSLPNLGDIRLGIKNKNDKGTEYPQNVDYFVLTDAPKVAQLFGEQPKELPIYLPFGTPDENLVAFYALWSGNNYSLCMGDGNLIRSRLDLADRTRRLVSDYRVVEAYAEEDTQRYAAGQHVPCSGKKQHLYPRCANCVPTSWLKVMVRDPHRPSQLILDELGYYEIRTQSPANYDTLIGRLDWIYGQSQRFGKTLQGIPLIIRRIEETMFYRSTDQNGQNQRRKSQQYLVDIIIDPAWIRAMQSASYQLALSTGVGAPEIPATVEVIDTETGEIITQPQAPAALPAPASTPATGSQETPERPWTAEFLKHQIALKVEKKRQSMPGPASEAQIGLAAGAMGKLVNDVDKDRYAVLNYLFGVVSTKDLDKAQASVAIDWAQSDEELSAKEAAAIIRAVLIAQGQQDMFPEDQVWPKEQREHFWEEVSKRGLSANQVYQGLGVEDHDDILCGECGTYEEVLGKLDMIKKQLDGQPTLV